MFFPTDNKPPNGKLPYATSCVVRYVAVSYTHLTLPTIYSV